MLLIEAKSCGTPVVMYDLPYLEIVQSKKGIISIAQDDIEGAARKLQDILEDDALCNRLVEEQISSLRDFYKNYDVSSSWENILNNPDQSFTPPPMIFAQFLKSLKRRMNSLKNHSKHVGIARSI